MNTVSYLSRLKEFGLNPKDWQVNLTNDPQKPGWKARLIHKSMPQFKLRARCRPLNINGEIVFEWSELKLA